MRLSLPTRIPWKYVSVFVVILVLVQLMEHTDPAFAGLCALFIALFTLGFNACQGLLYPSGSWIFFFGMLAAIVGIVGKAALGEPGQTNLLEPNKTLLLYCCGMAVISGACALARRFALKRPILGNFRLGPEMKYASIGCFLIGTFFTFATMRNVEYGGIESVLQQLNNFNRMGIILATFYEVRRSGGRRSSNWVVLASGSVLLFFGLIGFSKEGIFVPFLIWIISAISAGARFSRRQLVGGVLVGFFLVYYMVPYSQYGRRSREETSGGLRESIATVGSYLLDLNGTRTAYLSIAQDEDFQGSPHFYDKPEGLLDRENMLAFDDTLIARTDDGNVFGLSPVYIGFLNVIPHFLWPNKPATGFGNEYGREIGVIDSEDYTTGISFSPIADAYHEGKWVGVLLVLPLVVFLFAFTNDSLTGSIKDGPWALLPIALVAHQAPEGLLEGTIYLATTGLVNIFFVALLAKYVLPIATKVIIGADHTRVLPGRSFAPATLRTRPLNPGSASESA